MWGPAPAITPGVSAKSNQANINSSLANAPGISFSSILQGSKDSDGESNIQPDTNVNASGSSASTAAAAAISAAAAASGAAKSSKSKKKKGKRVLDTSLLGFTVQADPERKSGEIAHFDE